MFGDQPLPDEYSGGRDIVELKVQICIQCFDGSIRFPLFQNQGIDLDPTEHRVRDLHQCPVTAIDQKTQPMEWAFARVTKRRGVWEWKKLVIPTELYMRMLQSPGVAPGPATTAAGW